MEMFKFQVMRFNPDKDEKWYMQDYELELDPGVPLDDVREVSNYVAALHHGLGVAVALAVGVDVADAPKGSDQKESRLDSAPAPGAGAGRSADRR